MAEPVTPHQAEQSDVSSACIAQGPILASIESFTPPSQQEPGELLHENDISIVIDAVKRNLIT